mmetsp:Transcript_14528/g.33382  ORF Transcript_14528/g.33382 Transcript_14528/m.33382 type:complete len:209 (+) Transcript_14528:341-967(+)
MYAHLLRRARHACGAGKQNGIPASRELDHQARRRDVRQRRDCVSVRDQHPHSWEPHLQPPPRLGQRPESHARIQRRTAHARALPWQPAGQRVHDANGSALRQHQPQEGSAVRRDHRDGDGDRRDSVAGVLATQQADRQEDLLCGRGEGDKGVMGTKVAAGTARFAHRCQHGQLGLFRQRDRRRDRLVLRVPPQGLLPDGQVELPAHVR